jgi:type I restriction enzyme M protein
LLFNNELAKTSQEILFVKIENDGFDLGATKRPISKNDLPTALEILNKWNAGEKVENKLAVYVEKTKIAENGDYNLSGDRYRVATDYANAKWPMVKLGDVCDIYQPKTITSNEIKATGKYKVFGANGVIGYFDEYNHEEAEIAVTCRGATCGTVNFTEPRSWITGNAMVIKPKDSTLSKRYLFNLLRSTDLSSVISGAAQPQITGAALKPFLIPLPPLEIQEQVVEQVDGYQKIIEGIQQAVSAWMPRIEIDPEWEKVKLGEVIDLIRGVVYSKKDEVDSNGYQVLRAMNISLDGNIVLNDIKHISKNLKLKEHQKLLGGDIFICLASGSKDHIGKVAYIEKDTDYYFGGFMGAIRVNAKKSLSRFIYFLLRDGKFNDYLRDAISGANINNLNSGILGRFEIPLPPLEIQKQIVEKIEFERSKIEGAKELITIYQERIKATIAKLWAE